MSKETARFAVQSWTYFTVEYNATGDETKDDARAEAAAREFLSHIESYSSMSSMDIEAQRYDFGDDIITYLGDGQENWTSDTIPLSRED